MKETRERRIRGERWREERREERGKEEQNTLARKRIYLC